MKLPTVARCEKVLKLPAEKWKGKCYSIACELVREGLVPGVAVYGHWLGPVAEGSYFAYKKDAPFIQHGWVLPPDGGVIDPTRWVFENVAPYIYYCDGQNDPYYDEGGNDFREAMRGPPPVFNPKERFYRVPEKDMDDDTWGFVLDILQASPTDQPMYILSRSQLFYLGNTSPQRLGMYLPNVYRSLISMDCEAIIPMDNMTFYERTHASPTTENKGTVQQGVRRPGQPRRRAKHRG